MRIGQKKYVNYLENFTSSPMESYLTRSTNRIYYTSNELTNQKFYYFMCHSEFKKTNNITKLCDRPIKNDTP